MNLEDNMEELLNIDVEHVDKPPAPKVKSKDDFAREMMVRSTGDFDERYVCELNKEDSQQMLTEAMDLYPRFCTDGFQDFAHVLILGKVGNNLNDIMKKDRPTLDRLRTSNIRPQGLCAAAGSATALC